MAGGRVRKSDEEWRRVPAPEPCAIRRLAKGERARAGAR
jgi:hypothetical protein